MAKLHLATSSAQSIFFLLYHFICQSVAAIIKPPVQDVVQFLKEHIQHDIRCIARSTGNSDDEATRLIHLVLVGIVNSMDQQGGTFSFHWSEVKAKVAAILCTSQSTYHLRISLKQARIGGSNGVSCPNKKRCVCV